MARMWWLAWMFREPPTMRAMRLTALSQLRKTHHCGKCGWPVAVNAAGQTTLRRNPRIRVLCDVCRPLPATLLEAVEPRKRRK